MAADQDPKPTTTWLSTRDQGYQDRKMIKWLGFILSDHMEDIKKNKAHLNRPVVRQDKQSPQTISQILNEAYHHHQMVSVQLNYVYQGDYAQDIHGVVAGFDGPYIHIKTLDDFFSIELEVIHHVALLSPEKWYH